MLRLCLPPNLAASAPRDAVAVKVEVDLSGAPSQEYLAVLVVLQRLCGTPQPPPFVQLTRAQLRDLVSAAAGLPVFRWIQQPDTPLLWVGPRLRGVSEHLAEKSAATPVAPPQKTVAPARSLAPISRLPTASASAMSVDGSEHFLAVTLPSREHSTYAAVLELLKAQGFVLEPSNRKWWLRDRNKVLNFLAQQREKIETEFRAEFTDNFERNTERLRKIEIHCDVTEQGDGYNLTLGLKAGKASEEQLLQAAATNRGYVEDAGYIYLLAPETLQKLTRAQQSLAGHPGHATAARRTHRLGFARLNEAEEILAEAAPHFQPPEGWRKRSEALRNLSSLAPAPIPETFNALLRPYQRLGTAWLWHLHRHQLGGILADEMGLGKTLQALGLLTVLHPVGNTKRPPFSLVVCPASLVENWRREASRFAPYLRVFVHHGQQRLAKTAGVETYDLIVTSYGTLARDREFFADTSLTCLIADEAQHLKNKRTQNAQTLRSLQARTRILLTGTPLENSLDDLRSLFDILMPGFVESIPTGTRGDERGWYDERLRAKTAPFILRRTKKAVAPELPEKIEQVLYCEMSPEQAALYKKVQEDSERALFDMEAKGASENSIRFATLTQLLRLRQVCCDPRLIPGGAAESAAGKKDTGASAKLEAFRELLSESADDGHRLLVFSQFTSLLALLRTELETQEIPFCYLDGSMSMKARQAEVDRFNTSDDVPVFLISLKAGGTGLNLTAADTVVHFDPWWNPAVEAQATDRAHRIGQTRIVTSYKLICSGTVEEKVLQLQESKRALLADVFDASDAVSAKLSLADLKALLTP